MINDFRYTVEGERKELVHVWADCNNFKVLNFKILDTLQTKMYQNSHKYATRYIKKYKYVNIWK